jgi:hypothetical protein
MMSEANTHRPTTGSQEPVAGSPSDNTDLRTVLSGLEDEGFGTSLTAVDGGALRCGECGTASPATEFRIDRVRRLEGASDPDDMQMIVAAACPSCDAHGVAVLGFGPGASEVDADVVVDLP